MTIHKLHQWTDENRHDWYCVESDSGELLNPRDLDGPTTLGVEEICELLEEITVRDLEIIGLIDSYG